MTNQTTKEFLEQWVKLGTPLSRREDLIREYGLQRDVFLERMAEFLNEEAIAQIKALPEDTYFWPNGVGDFTAGTKEDLVSLTCTFEYERTDS